MNKLGEALIRDLDEVGGHLRGHFKLRSGRCSNQFFKFAMLGRRPLRLRYYAVALAFELDRYHPQVVIAVAKGGIAIGQEVAGRLSVLQRGGEPPIESLYAEKARFDEVKGVWLADESSEQLRLLRGFDALVADRTVGIIEDAVTTGGSSGRLAAHVRELGGEVVVLGTLLQRGEIRSEHLAGVPVEAVCRATVDDWDLAECPMHARGEPYTPIPGKN